jgi:hypothetical protein
MAEQDWTPSTITLSHLQKIVKHGFMSGVKLKPYRVPVDPAFPMPAEGDVVSFTAFFDRGFSVPSHQFLHLLLRYYGLELHHLTPSGLLHITAFVTLCEAYLGIDPDLDLLKYFFRVQHPQDPEVELTTSRGTVIHVKLGHGVDPYLEIPMPRSMKGWQKKWFYLKNDDSAPLPVFTSGHLVPLPSYGEGWLGGTLARNNPCVSIFSNCDKRG